MRKWIPVAAAAIAAIISAIIKHPTGEMIVSMPWGSLFTILMISACYSGLKREHAFFSIRRAASSADSVFGMLSFLVLSAAVLAPFITSYLAALAIMPIASEVLKDAEKDEYIPRTLAFIAAGAAIGGFLLPTGSFHNLFISEGTELSSISVMALPALIAVVLLFAFMAASMGKSIRSKIYIHPELEDPERNRSLMIFHGCLVFVVMLSSMGIFTWLDILIFTVILTLLFDRSVYKEIDYRMFLFLVLLSFALTNFRTEMSGWIAYIVSEIFGSTAASLIAVPSEAVMKAVNAGSLGLLASVPAAIGLIEARKTGKAKEYCLWYIPPTLIISIVLMILPI